MSASTQNPIVSVIVPCYNYGRFLSEALESVRKQSFTDWECIVVDNGSTDNTKEVMQGFVNVDKRFRYFLHENKGVSKARNFAIKNCLGKYILPLDADDKIGHDYLMEAVKVLENKPALKIVYSEAQLFGEVNRKWENPDFSIENMLKENCIFCSAFFKKEDFDKTKGYNEEMLIGFEDWNFWLELLRSGGEVYKIPKVHFYYRVRKSSRNNTLGAEKQKLLRRQIYQNHKDQYEKYLNISDTVFEWYQKKELLKTIKSSKEFKIGRFIFAPLRMFKSWTGH